MKFSEVFDKSTALRDELEKTIAAFETETGGTVENICLTRTRKEDEPLKVEKLDVNFKTFTIHAGRNDVPF